MTAVNSLAKLQNEFTAVAVYTKQVVINRVHIHGYDRGNSNRILAAMADGNPEQVTNIAKGITLTGGTLSTDVVAGTNSVIKDEDGTLGGVVGGSLLAYPDCNPADALYK